MRTDRRGATRPRLGAAAIAGCLAGALLLGGCAGSPATLASPTSSTAPGDDSRTSSPSAGATSSASRPPTSREAGPATSPERSPTPTGSPGADEGGEDDGTGSSPALEVPVEPEATVDSLGDLLPGGGDRPLVTLPLPKPSSARGRLTGGFPQLLRPVPASRVETSSVSVAGDRLQVALVGSTSWSPAQVLLAYRARLSGRGLAEHGTAPASPGSEAAAMSRGQSRVTITVTRQGTRTSYSVIASLSAGQG